MKRIILTPLLLLLFGTGFSQNSGRFNPTANKEDLDHAQSVNDIIPGLWNQLWLNHGERLELNFRRSIEYPQGYHAYHDANNYDRIIDYVSVEISGTGNGKTITAQSTSSNLTAEQKSILSTADIGSDIHIKISFKYKNTSPEQSGSDSKLIAGGLKITVIPDIEAVYPGGYSQINEYLKTTVIDKMPAAKTSAKMMQAVVKFTVDEEGRVTDARISRTSSDPKIDKAILDAVNRMPKWRPAQNSKGIKVKEDFSIPLGGMEGC